MSKILEIGTLLVFGQILITNHVSSFAVGPRVVNGTNATQGEFPFMANIKYAGDHLCGGTFLTPEWVLTAGHCVSNDVVRYDLEVYYGHIKDGDDNFDNLIMVTKYITHPNFTYIVNTTTFLLHNDVALLHLAQPVSLNKNVQLVKLPKQGEEAPINQTATLIGWGYIDSYSTFPAVLQKEDLTIYDHEYCAKEDGPLVEPITNICAGNGNNTMGQCNGDSGGPLMHNGVQWGIVSWSKKPCITAPGIFTNVAPFVDWINEVTGRNDDKK